MRSNYPHVVQKKKVIGDQVNIMTVTVTYTKFYG